MSLIKGRVYTRVKLSLECEEPVIFPEEFAVQFSDAGGELSVCRVRREEGQRSCGKPTCCSHPRQIEANEGQADPWMQALSK